MQTLRRYILWTLLAAVGMLGILGCNGPAPGLDPVISFTFPDETRLPNLASGAVLHVKGEASTADDEANPIVSYQWTQTPAGIGTFSSTRTLETTWQAPVVAATTPVQLAITAESLLGGKTVKTLDLLIQPLGGADLLYPTVAWNFSAMNYLDAASVPVINLPRMRSAATLQVKGTITELNAAVNPITGYAWTQTAANPGDPLGTFGSPNTFQTAWEAPTVAVRTTIVLNLQITTLLGFRDYPLQVVVLPPGEVP